MQNILKVANNKQKPKELSRVFKKKSENLLLNQYKIDLEILKIISTLIAKKGTRYRRNTLHNS